MQIYSGGAKTEKNGEKMSADNWAECPLCKSKRVKALKKLSDKYGKIPQEDYERLKEELDSKHDDECEGTPLREDYEIGVDEKGLCYVIYSGVCQYCGATWKFDKRDILPEDAEDKVLVRKLK